MLCRREHANAILNNKGEHNIINVTVYKILRYFHYNFQVHPDFVLNNLLTKFALSRWQNIILKILFYINIFPVMQNNFVDTLKRKIV